MDPVTLDQLNVFLEVAEAGSFSAAARRMRRAQSAVSYSVANLEALLRVQLFERRGRKPVLTEAGQALLPNARAVTFHVDELRARAHRLAEGVEPRLSLAVDALLPMQPLVVALRALRDEYPQVELVLHREALGAVAELLLTDRCQLGCSAPLDPLPRGLTQLPLTTTRLVPVVAPEHPLAQHDGPLPTRLLDQHVQLVLTDRSARTEGQDHAVLSSRSWRLADLHTKHSLLVAGFGWGTLPAHLAEPAIADGSLVPIRAADYLARDLEVVHFAIYRTADPPGAAGRWLLDRLRGAFTDAGTS